MSSLGSARALAALMGMVLSHVGRASAAPTPIASLKEGLPTPELWSKLVGSYRSRH